MKEFNEYGEPIETPKKKKFNLFSGYNKDGKEIKKEDVIKNYDFFTFFKLYYFFIEALHRMLDPNWALYG